MSKFIFITCWCLISFNMQCQTQSIAIRGYIVDSVSGDSIFNAEIMVVNQDSVCTSTVSDFDGSFFLNPVTCNSKCILRINASGYKTKEIELNIPEDKKWLMLENITLERVE